MKAAPSFMATLRCMRTLSASRRCESSTEIYLEQHVSSESRRGIAFRSKSLVTFHDMISAYLPLISLADPLPAASSGLQRLKPR